jgi:hypothetical protein
MDNRAKIISTSLASNNKGGVKKGYRSFSYTYGNKGTRGFQQGSFRGKSGSVSEGVRKVGISAGGKGTMKPFSISGGGKAGKATHV